MSILRRYHGKGNVYFITNVAYEREPVLIDNVDILWGAFNSVSRKSPFALIAWVILPDHFHIVIDPRQNHISNLLQRIKMSFAAFWRKQENLTSGRIWQKRFWDHIIRDQIDLNRHIDYIHFNPVKHGYVNSPFDWLHSSIHKYHTEGFYTRDWGLIDTLEFKGEFGE
jgi:putative transposase